MAPLRRALTEAMAMHKEEPLLLVPATITSSSHTMNQQVGRLLATAAACAHGHVLL